MHFSFKILCTKYEILQHKHSGENCEIFVFNKKVFKKKFIVLVETVLKFILFVEFDVQRLEIFAAL